MKNTVTKIIGSINSCKNLVIKLRLRNIPVRKYFFFMKWHIDSKAKKVEGIAVSIVELWNKKVGLKARKNTDSNAMFSLKIFFPIIKVRYMQPMLNISSRILPNIIGLSLIFHIKPSKMGIINGLDGSHSPTFPIENIYFPIPM